MNLCEFHRLGAPPTMTAAELRTLMRKLWEEHVQWTRMVIISFAAGLPDLTFAEARLMKNQDDLGAAVGQFYGREAGEKLAGLLREHILGAKAVLVAARAGAPEAAVAAWRRNGQQIADFLSAANPVYWPQPVMRQMMQQHLDTTLAEATARLGGRWADDVTAYDAARAHILRMADALAAGIAAQKGLA